MKIGLIKAGLFILSLVFFNGLFIGAQWLEGFISRNLNGFISLIIGFPLRVFVIIFIAWGWYISLYFIWKISTQGKFEKVVIWFLRVAVVFLVLITISQIGLLIADGVPYLASEWDYVRYNLFQDLGRNAAAWYLSLRAVQATNITSGI